MEGLDDQVVKVTLTDKIPTLLLGAYKAAAKASMQYPEEVIRDRNLPNAKALIDTFAVKFFSHGYPMDAAFPKEVGIDVSGLDYGPSRWPTR